MEFDLQLLILFPISRLRPSASVSWKGSARTASSGRFDREVSASRYSVPILFTARSNPNPSQYLIRQWKKGLIERIHIESCTRNADLYLCPHVGTSVPTWSDAIYYVRAARWYAFSRCRRTDGDCVRFRVDRRLIDMNQDRKNQRDQNATSVHLKLDRSCFMRLTPAGSS